MRYALREAVAAFRRAPVLTGLAASMVGLALFVFGLFALAAFNLDEALRAVESRVEVVAYLGEGARIPEVELARVEIGRLQEVEEVRFVSKEMALERARRDMPELQEMLAELTTNPLPASLEIRLSPAFRTQEAVDRISVVAASFPVVEEVAYGREWVEKLFSLRRVAGATVAVLGSAFALVAALIIGTALKIAVFARRDEIYVMRLVGARDGFIRMPFLLEGALAGAMGGALAALLTYLTYRLTHALLFTLSWMPGAWVLAGIAAGAVFGVIASGVSVRRHLREV